MEIPDYATPQQPWLDSGIIVSGRGRVRRDTVVLP
jgi:hypothetical protein